MARVARFKRSALLSLVACSWLAPLTAQTLYHGTLDPGLRSSPDVLSIAIFDPITAESAAAIGVASQPGDKLFSGSLNLGGTGAPRYRLRAIVVRGSGGADVLYVDSNQNSHFDPEEQIPFRPLPDSDQNKGQSSVAYFDTVLLGDPMGIFPMQVRLITEPWRTKAKPGQLPVLYSALAFVQGRARLPHRKLLVRFQYDFETMSVAIDNGHEWLDLNGDGKFDMNPGSPEFLRANGSAPVFRVDNRTLQLASVDLAHGTFVLRAVAASANTRFPLAVGSVLPDFAFHTLDGAPRHLSGVKGKLVMLDFWATWCEPCMANMIYLQSAYGKFHSQGFEILGMDGDENPATAAAALRKMNMTWPEARYDKALFSDRFQISTWGLLILLDDHRKIISTSDAKQLPLDGNQLSTTLATLLGNHP